MNGDKTAIWALLIIAVIQLLLDIFTFYKIWTGKRYKIFLWLVAMLFIGNIGDLTYALALAAGFKYNFLLIENDIVALGGMISGLFSSEVHWIVAIYYTKMVAYNIPKEIDGLQDQLKDYKRTMWVGAALIAISPVLEFVAWVIQNREWNTTGSQTAWADLLY